MKGEDEKEIVAQYPEFPTPGEEAILRFYLDEVGTITIGRGREYFDEQMKNYKAWHKAQRDDPKSPARYKRGWTPRHMIQQYVNTGRRMKRRYDDVYGPGKWPRIPER